MARWSSRAASRRTAGAASCAKLEFKARGHREPHAARAVARGVRGGQLLAVADLPRRQADGAVLGDEVRGVGRARRRIFLRARAAEARQHAGAGRAGRRVAGRSAGSRPGAPRRRRAVDRRPRGDFGIGAAGDGAGRGGVPRRAAPLAHAGHVADLREPRHAGGLRGHEGQRETDREAGSWRQRERDDDGVGSECARAAHRREDRRGHADARAVRRIRAGRGESRWRGRTRRSKSAARSPKPEFTGNIDATKLQADLGELGIELREGSVRGEAKRTAADSSSTAAWLRARAVSSSTARWTSAASWTSKILGQNFLAADIPAANVVVTPDLTLTGDSKGYLLNGEVTIPQRGDQSAEAAAGFSRPACRRTWW